MRKVDIAREYRIKHPDMPSLKLARIMYAKESAAFKDVEDCRRTIRVIEGKAGKADRHIVTNPAPNRPYNPYKLPESDEAKYEPYVLKYKRILCLSDIHAPYHSKSALTAVIKYAKEYKPDCILLNGDFFDFHGMSRFLKDPRKKNFAQEIAIGCELLNVFNKEIGAPIVFKLGNHDERYQHYLWTKLGEIGDLEDFELYNIIGKRVKGVTVVDGKRIIKAGKLNIVHGHEFGGSVFSPVNIARGFYLRAKASTIGGHHHQTSEHTESNIEGDIVTTWSTGCLCELHPEYLPINKWNHGFATIDVQKDGKYTVKNYRIYNGKIL